jgi:hypothetical protein
VVIPNEHKFYFKSKSRPGGVITPLETSQEITCFEVFLFVDMFMWKKLKLSISMSFWVKKDTIFIALALNAEEIHFEK